MSNCDFVLVSMVNIVMFGLGNLLCGVCCCLLSRAPSLVYIAARSRSYRSPEGGVGDNFVLRFRVRTLFRTLQKCFPFLFER